jgi:cytochrome c biogenesis protein CcdA
MAIVGVLVSLLGRYALSTILEANLISRVALSALVYGGLGVIAILIGLRSLGLLSSLPSIPGLQPINQLFSARAENVQGFDRRMFAFGALYGGGMAAGCPVPLYWALLFWVAINANPIFGALVLGVHALGYAAPVLAIGVLSRMGISVIKSVPKRGERLQMFVSAGMLTTGVYLVTLYIVIRLATLFL